MAKVVPLAPDTDEPNALPLCWRPSEAARRLGLARSTIYELIAAHEIPHLRVRNRILVPRMALEEWIAHRIQPARDDPKTTR